MFRRDRRSIRTVGPFQTGVQTRVVTSRRKRRTPFHAFEPLLQNAMMTRVIAYAQKPAYANENDSSQWLKPYLELEVFDLAVQVLSQHIARLRAFLQCLFGLHLESIAVLLDLSLEQIQAGIKVCLHSICAN